MEHLRELRDRLFRASLGILAGMVVGWLVAGRVRHVLQSPYCDITRDFAIENNKGTLPANWKCQFVQLGPADLLLLDLKVAMWVGLVVSGPIWLYQLWAFIAPGLHRHERRWAYAFVSIAAPLFALGAVLAYFVVSTGLQFLLKFSGDDIQTNLEITRYIDFVTGLMMIFGVAFEFPLVALLLNIAGVVSARKLLGWWRVAVFAFFAFAAVATPTADPFGMSALGAALSGLYFGAVGLAFLNDRRRRRRDRDNFAELPDDQISPLEYDTASVDELDPVATSGPVTVSGPVAASDPVLPAQTLDRRYDDVT